MFSQELSVKIPKQSEVPFKIDTSHISSESMIPVDKDVLGLSFRSGELLSGKFTDQLSRSFEGTVGTMGSMRSPRSQKRSPRSPKSGDSNNLDKVSPPRANVKVVTHVRISQLNQLIEAKRK